MRAMQASSHLLLCPLLLSRFESLLLLCLAIKEDAALLLELGNVTTLLLNVLVALLQKSLQFENLAFQSRLLSLGTGEGTPRC